MTYYYVPIIDVTYAISLLLIELTSLLDYELVYTVQLVTLLLWTNIYVTRYAINTSNYIITGTYLHMARKFKMPGFLPPRLQYTSNLVHRSVVRLDNFIQFPT
jgi:hypothetical protein